MNYELTKEIFNDKIVITIEQNYHPDFSINYLRFFINRSDLILTSIFISSNEYGTVYWENGKGLRDPHKWEYSVPSGINRHYPVLFQNGPTSLEYAKEKIIPDILHNLNKPEIEMYLQRIVEKKEDNEPINLGLFE